MEHRALGATNGAVWRSAAIERLLTSWEPGQIQHADAAIARRAVIYTEERQSGELSVGGPVIRVKDCRW